MKNFILKTIIKMKTQNFKFFLAFYLFKLKKTKL